MGGQPRVRAGAPGRAAFPRQARVSIEAERLHAGSADHGWAPRPAACKQDGRIARPWENGPTRGACVARAGGVRAGGGAP